MFIYTARTQKHSINIKYYSIYCWDRNVNHL